MSSSKGNEEKSYSSHYCNGDFKKRMLDRTLLIGKELASDELHLHR
jgi:hypothetical protein